MLTFEKGVSRCFMQLLTAVQMNDVSWLSLCRKYFKLEDFVGS